MRRKRGLEADSKRKLVLEAHSKDRAEAGEEARGGKQEKRARDLGQSLAHARKRAAKNRMSATPSVG
jgi:hypothetical protein